MVSKQEEGAYLVVREGHTSAGFAGSGNSGSLGLEHSHLHVPIRISGSHSFMRALTLSLKTCEGCSFNNLGKSASETTAPGREPQTVCPQTSGEEEVFNATREVSGLPSVGLSWELTL